MEQGFIDSIQKMINGHGKDTLLDARKAKSMLGDLTANQFKDDTNLLKQLLDADCANIINGADNVAEAKAGLVKRLEEKHNISPKGSAVMLDLLGLVLRGDTSKCGEKPEKPIKPALSQELTSDAESLFK
jgi:hypothetical protein